MPADRSWLKPDTWHLAPVELNFMQFQEVVHAQGHLIDSHIMEQIFDQVVEFGGRFEVEEFRVGRTNSEPSYLRLKVESGERADMERLLQQLLGLGCSPVDSGDAGL